MDFICFLFGHELLNLIVVLHVYFSVVKIVGSKDILQKPYSVAPTTTQTSVEDIRMSLCDLSKGKESVYVKK